MITVIVVIMTIVIWCAPLTQAQMVFWSWSDCFVVFITIIIMIIYLS